MNGVTIKITKACFVTSIISAENLRNSKFCEARDCNGFPVHLKRLFFKYVFLSHRHFCTKKRGSTGLLISPLARPGRNQATFPAFYETWRSLPPSQESTTCPYPS